MQRDAHELNPGCPDFWDHFYDVEDGRLQAKEMRHRKAREIAERGSLMDHYEWFMEFSRYEAALKACLRRAPTALAHGAATRVLHVGCGNSDFCDHVGELMAGLGGAPSPSATAAPPVVLNIDICKNIIDHLASQFPTRLYAVGNCCDLHVSPSPTPTTAASWYVVDAHRHLQTVVQSSVDVVFDKGTADARLSSFAGDYNPNMESYMAEVLKVLRPGGLLFLISINSEDVVTPYALSAEDGAKALQLVYSCVIELDARETQHLRVETLGSRYSVYGYIVTT
ncbi:hypothetical protein NESM_000153300 [Novymonas esmeraldas]|uniref:Methyltransferase type 11 domain-containing protein n=1 Tax=Novymonas esmeraldas TaxID=1808958 RepID=A0AAW0F721_9TRYP